MPRRPAFSTAMTKLLAIALGLAVLAAAPMVRWDMDLSIASTRVLLSIDAQGVRFRTELSGIEQASSRSAIGLSITRLTA